MTPAVVVDGRRYSGQGIDLRDEEVAPETVVAALDRAGNAEALDGEPDDAATAASADRTVAYHGPSPGVGHGILREPADGRPTLRATLAAAARSRGLTASVDDDIEGIRAQLASLSVGSASTAAQRRRESAAGADVAELRERVAALRGQLEARREVGAPTEAVAEKIAAAAAELSEAETERVAAEQALADAERRSRPNRAARRRRLRLQDRLANLERDARAELAAAVHDDFAAAAEAVPGAVDAGDDPGSISGDRLAARYAALRVADLDAPVVLTGGRFPDADAAAATLSTPVVRV
ncbi:MAG: hypothetical protein ABEJ79_07745 [Halolamina sp.]